MNDVATQGASEALLDQTTAIASAFFSNPNNKIDPSDVSGLITNVYSALSGLGQSQPVAAKPEPKVPVRASVKPDYIVCLEDGKKLKMLKRHLMTHYQMTPDQYRSKWGLNADYPMVAPNYAETRRTLAKKIGLGHSRKRAEGSAPAATGGESAPAPRARRTANSAASGESRSAPKAQRRGRRKAQDND